VLSTVAAAMLVATSPGVPAVAASSSSPKVLLVGSFQGVQGGYRTIQSAVNAARPGDWVLIGPGDYHEHGTDEAGVYVSEPNIHLRGMDRNQVIVDGTRAAPTGSIPRPCDPSPAAQNFGVKNPDGTTAGRNGIEAFEVDGVSIENLTACNFLSASDGENGNEIWWNGGDGSGTTNLGAYRGAYISATSTYYKDPTSPMAQYGIFASNSFGPGVLIHTYAGNMGDGAYYVGACPDCNVVITDAHAQNSALAYSGTNSGGNLIIQRSEFDLNKTGIVPNSLNNDDAPPPQDGACPPGQTGPTGTSSCTVIRNNYVHDNNNPNVPAFGLSGEAPIGTGIEISGGQNDTIVGNRIVRNGSWGVLIHDFPDTEEPPPVSHCEGGIQTGPVCFFQAFGNEVAGNTFTNNGFFGNPGNADIGNEASSAVPGNCFHDNTDTSGTLTSDPPAIETVDGTCGGPAPGDTTLAAQIVCASGVLEASGFPPCPPDPPTNYPQTTKVSMIPMPPQATMPNPCSGVPANPWCASGGSRGPGSDPAGLHGGPAGYMANGQRDRVARL